MAYDGIIAELPAGWGGMVNHENRLLAKPTELLTAAGLTFEDDHNRKEAGSSNFDSNGIANAPYATGTWSTTASWGAVLATYKGSGTPAVVKTIATALGPSTITTTITLTVPVGGVALNNFISVAVLDSDVTDPTITITDTGGNTYTQSTTVAYSGAFRIRLFHATASVALVAGNTITLTLSAAPTATNSFAVTAVEFTNVSTSSPLDRTATKTGSGTAITVGPTTPLSQVPELLIYVAAPNNAATHTAGSSFTEQSEHDGLTVSFRVDTTSPTIIALNDWWPTNTVQRIITATTDGKVYKEVSGDLDSVTLVSGLSTTARPGRFVAAGKEAAANNRKLFYFNGTDVVRVLSDDAATMTSLATPPADWASTNQPVNAVVHNLRLVGFGNLNDPHRLYFSDPDNHENFTSADSYNMRVASHIGDRLFCAVSFNGILFAWKHPRGIFYLDDSDTNTDNWVIRAKSEALGCVPSPYGVLPIDDDVLFMAADGSLHLLSAVDTMGGVRASSITYLLGLSKWTRENVNLSRLSQVVSVWYPHKKVALFGVPATGSNTNTMTLKLDFGALATGGSLRFSYTTRDNPDAFAIRRDSDTIERPIIGEAGFVYKMDQETRAKDGVAYTSTYQTPHHDFSWIDDKLRSRRKLFDHLELIFEPVGQGTVTVEVYVDNTLKQTLTYDATVRRQKKALQVGDGHTFSLKVTSSTLNDDFKILAHLVYFKPGNEDQGR